MLYLVRLLCFVCMCTWMAPAFAADYDELVREALELRNRGDQPGAEALLREARALAADPREATVLLALVIAYQERFDEADELLRDALESWPEDEDLELARARVAFYRGRNDEARDILGRLLAAHPANLEARNLAARLRRAEEPTGPRHQVMVSLGVSDANRSWFERWHDRVAEYRHLAQNGNQQYLRIEDDTRFGTRDTLLEAGWRIAAERAVPIEISFGVTQDAEFLPRVQWRVGARWSLDTLLDGGVLTAAYREARYRSGTVRTIDARLEIYPANSVLWFDPGVGMLRDESGRGTFMWRVGMHGQASDELRLGLNYIDAPDTDDNVTTETRTWHAYAAYRFDARTSFRVDLTRNQRQNSYTRESITASVERRI